MAERIPDSLIDEILASTRKYMVEETETEYSTDKVDAILADISGEEKKTVEVSSKTVVVPVFKKEKKDFKLHISEIENAVETQYEETTEKKGEIDVVVNDGGQMGLVSDGVEIGSEIADEEQAETEEKEELKSVSGQISIEKTRMFNKVDIRGAYNPNISHNLVNKV